jgi:hypothetical protein
LEYAKNKFDFVMESVRFWVRVVGPIGLLLEELNGIG